MLLPRSILHGSKGSIASSMRYSTSDLHYTECCIIHATITFLEKLMKIYFSCSITGGRKEEGIYQACGRNAQTWIWGTHSTSFRFEHNGTGESRSGGGDFNRDMNWLQDCDVVVAEVHSFTRRGLWIAIALTSGKPVFVVISKTKVSRSLR